VAQWADFTEEAQTNWLASSKEQMEYMRINAEYDFVKKRALVNFLTNSRKNVEDHMHGRAQNMLTSIERYEQANLKSLINEISKDSFAKIQQDLANPESKARIQDQFFQSALIGLRKGVMEYENDPLLPILQNEIQQRTASYKNLSAEEERQLLMLTDAQKKAIVEQDKSTKNAYLATAPKMSHAGVKAHQKFVQFTASIGSQH